MQIDPRVSKAQTVPGIRWCWVFGAKYGIVHGFVLNDTVWEVVGACGGSGAKRKYDHGTHCSRCIKAALKLGGL